MGAFRSAAVVDRCRRFGPSFKSRTRVRLGVPEWWGGPCFHRLACPSTTNIKGLTGGTNSGEKTRGNRGVHTGRKHGEVAKWLISPLEGAMLDIKPSASARWRQGSRTKVPADPMFPMFTIAYLSLRIDRSHC